MTSKRGHSSVAVTTVGLPKVQDDDDESSPPRKKNREEPNIEALKDDADGAQRIMRSLSCRADKSTNKYEGYSLQKNPPEVGSIESLTAIDPKEFFTRFVATRRPCIIGGLDIITDADGDDDNDNNNNNSHYRRLSPKDLVALAGKELVQVEKRFSTSENFGQNRTNTRQLTMTMEDFVDKLSGDDGDMFYLSTQQSPNDNDDDDADNDDNDYNDDDDDVVPSSSSPFQVPCRQLLDANIIKETLTLAGNLRLESCNLWMGSSHKGSSSGLHHDYHDNFYLLFQGKKQFRLYSPDTAHGMNTYGIIEKIHFNGVISYQGSETGANGMPLQDSPSNGSDVEEEGEEEEFVLGKGFDYNSSDEENDFDDNGSDDFEKLAEEETDPNGDGSAKGSYGNEEEEEEFVVGKGFDYHSSDEENDFDDNGSDDFEKLAGEGVGQDSDDSAEGPDDGTERPNNFCRLDFPIAASNETRYRESIVKLKAGEMLYLPAGWFHCVTSFSPPPPEADVAPATQASAHDQIHMALNYWYHPPDQLKDFEKPYTDIVKK